jgi:repressor of nif and glnA expression
MGLDLQPRTIRYYLLQLDERGLTQLVSRRRGRVITEQGREEAARTDVAEKTGIVASRIDTLCYRMSFDPATGTGTVITNISYLDPADLGTAAAEIQLVVDRGLAISSRIIVAGPGTELGGALVPEGRLAIATPCSVSLNGILQKRGIPVVSRFAGLLEIRNRQTVRFVDLIEYAGTTLDPLEIFIRAGMTRVRNVVLRGSGIICASFREVPSVAVDEIRRIEKQISRHGLGGILEIGRPNQPLFGIPVNEGYCGMVVAGGLNPIASLCETGMRLVPRSLAGLADYRSFVPVKRAIRAHGA